MNWRSDNISGWRCRVMFSSPLMRSRSSSFSALATTDASPVGFSRSNLFLSYSPDDYLNSDASIYSSLLQNYTIRKSMEISHRRCTPDRSLWSGFGVVKMMIVDELVWSGFGVVEMMIVDELENSLALVVTFSSCFSLPEPAPTTGFSESIVGFESSVAALVCHALLETYSGACSIKVWSLASGECIHELNSDGNQFHSCVFHPSYSTLLVIGGLRALVLWNMVEWRFLCCICSCCSNSNSSKAMVCN